MNAMRYATSIASLACLALTMAPVASATTLDDLVERLASDLTPQAAATLGEISGVDRKLLAARSYLRAGAKLESRWSWSDDEIATYQLSQEYRAALAEIDKVIAAFEGGNPGYTLYVNREIRSLDLQLARWNENDSVGAAAAELAAAVRARGVDPVAKDAVATLRKLLVDWQPSTPAALAAPGLSPHGQMRAVDFQIMRDGRVVASTRTASAAREWDAPGWTEKLRVAVTTASKKFEGPLRAPREPWHYSYAP